MIRESGSVKLRCALSRALKGSPGLDGILNRCCFGSGWPPCPSIHRLLKANKPLGSATKLIAESCKSTLAPNLLGREA